MYHFRTKEGHERYYDAIANGALAGNCKLCEAASIKEFTHWRIIRNKYPYDAIAKQHDMLITREHLDEKGIPTEAWIELRDIKRTYINDHYFFIIEPTDSTKSIPTHYHLHLIVPKDVI